MTLLAPALREETAQHHHSIEEVSCLKRIFSDTYTLSEYIDLLKRYYGFYQPLESALLADEAFVAMFAMSGRTKLDKLTADLKQAGVTDEELASLPVNPALPPLGSLPAKAGCLYVLEGSTLGSQLIVRRLREQFDEGAGLAFYTGYGEQTGPKWQAFKQILEITPELNEPEAIQQAVESAQKTFVVLTAWLTQQEAPMHA